MMLVGLGKGDITPPVGMPMGGYVARDGRSVGIHDRLSARCFLFQDDVAAVGVLVLDVLGLSAEWVKALQAVVQEIAGIAAQNVVAAATHTHAGPAGFVDTGCVSPRSDLQERKGKALLAGTREAVRRAAASMFAARLGVGCERVPGIASHRTDWTRSIDDSLWLLRIDDTSGRLRGALANFPCHSTVLGSDNRYLSADLLGTAASNAELVGDVTAIIAVTNGASGDVSTRFCRKAQNFEELKHLSRILSVAMLDVTDGIRTRGGACLTVGERSCWLPYKPASSVVHAQTEIDRLEGRLAGKRVEDNHPGERRVIETRLEGARGLLDLLRSGCLARGGETVVLKGVRLGDGIFIAVPGEPFNSLVQRVRATKRPEQKVTVFGCSNGYVGYFPDRSATDAGWYEAQISCFDWRSAEILAEEATVLLAKLGGASNGPNLAAD